MKPLHILIAEDESLIRMGLKCILEEAGHTVHAAEDGQAALELAETRTPDIAILDIRMPRMDGMEAARRLYERTPIPILFLTAYGERELVEKAARLPIQGYLVKPLREAELFAMIEVAMGRFEEHARTARVAADASAALADQRTIQRAKGMLMQQDGISELEAHGRLEKRARSERRSLLEVAEEVGRQEAAGGRQEAGGGRQEAGGQRNGDREVGTSPTGPTTREGPSPHESQVPPESPGRTGNETR